MDIPAIIAIISSVVLLGVLAPLGWGGSESTTRHVGRPERLQETLADYMATTSLVTDVRECFDSLWAAACEAGVRCCAWVEGSLAPEFRVRASRVDDTVPADAVSALLMSEQVRCSLGSLTPVVQETSSVPTGAARRVGTILVAPLVSGGELMGSLVMATSHDSELSPDCRSFLVTLAGVFAGHCEREALRRESELARRGSRELIDAVPALLVGMDAEGSVVLFNRGAEMATGLRAADVLGHDGSRCFGRLADEVDLQAMLTREILRPTAPTVRTRLTVPGHKETMVDWSVRRLCHENGEPMMALAAGVDVTTNARLETELVHLERLATAGQLLAGTAHELNNPLAAVVGFSELLQQFRSDERCRDYLDKLNSQAQRAKRIVGNLLTFAREQPADHQAVSPHELVSQTLELVRYQMEVKNVTFRVSVAPDLPDILGNPHELQQVLVNLLTNARDALAEVGGGEVDVSADVEGHLVRLVVGDSGPGIRGDLLASLFEPFVTSKPQGSGTGLGLSISQGIIQQHKGTITARNRDGGGAEFTITLPAEEGMSPGTVRHSAKPSAARCSDRDGCGYQVLVIDDEEMLRSLVADVLSDEGYTVDQAANGDEALQLVIDNDYGAVICDLKMPGLGGEIIYERICELKPSLARRVIFATGDTSGQACEEIVRRAGNKLLCKPFSINQLIDVTSQVAMLQD